LSLGNALMIFPAFCSANQPQLVEALKVEPEFGAGPAEMAEAQRGVASNGALADVAASSRSSFICADRSIPANALTRLPPANALDRLSR